MPLTKQYLRYEHSATFGVVCSQRSNAVLLEKGGGAKGTSGLRAVVPALEDVYVWDVRTGRRVHRLKGDKREVTSLVVSTDGKTVAAGHEDGGVVLWDMEAQASHVTLSGHKSAVTCLSFDRSSTRLASGGKDTHLIVWDVINEAGLFRLLGHKGPITHCVFMKNSNTVISSSKDTFVKLWDLDTQHCFHTIVGHRSEVWSFTLLKNETRLVTGSSDLELRVYSLSTEESSSEGGSGAGDGGDSSGAGGGDGEVVARLGSKRRPEENESKVPFTCELKGTLKKLTHENVVSLKTDRTERLLLCHTRGNKVEAFLIRSSEELLELTKKREKKAKRKERKQAKSVDPIEVTFEDEFVRLPPLKAGAKVKAIDLLMTRSGQIKVLACLINNTLEIWSLAVSPKDKEIERTSVQPLSAPGHTADVRCVSFSSDDTCIVSGSAHELKVWNKASQQCIRTLPSGYALCTMVAPGDRHVFLGTKSGEVQLFDIGAGSLLETFPAHTGPVWGIDLSPDKCGFVTGSADHDVKFWEFELMSTDDGSQMTKRVLTAAHVRTLKMTEDVLSVKYSPNQKLLLVALLDSTVKVFFSDTLKFFLSLYGHRLPVLCMDVSSDSTLLVTGSSDKNIKIWGLDFGDCHRSIFAHDDSIMCVQFVPDTHLVFSASKDKILKCWDADKFELVSTLEGHQGEVWCLAVSHDGDKVVTGSHDHSLRLWERTDEPLILSEERENEREAEFEEAAVKDGEPVIPGETSQEVGLAGRKTLESVKAAERVMEAVELSREERAKLAEHREKCAAARKELPLPTPNPILVAFGNLTPERYVLEVLKRIRSSELEESLLVMPFDFVVDLLHLLKHWLERGWEVELSCRCLFFLLRVHHKQIVANQMLVSVIDSLKQVTREKVTQLKDMVGINLAGLQFCQRELENSGVHVFDDVSVKVRKAKRKKLTVVQ